MVRDLWGDFKGFVAAHWKKGRDETELQSYRRAIADANSVSQLLDAKGWEVLRTRFAGELLNELNLLSVQMRSGNLSDEALKMRTARICAKTDFMEVIRAVLLEGEAAKSELNKMVAQLKEQAAEGVPSVEALAAQG